MGESSHVIGQSLVDAATVAYRTYLEEFFTSTDDGIANILAETIPAGDAKSATLIVEDYLGTWLEFVGARQTTASRAYSQTITLTTWAQQLKIRRLDVERDQIGVTAARLRRFLSAQKSYKDQLVNDMLVSASGLGPTGYDGVALIGTTHPNGPAGNQSNKGTTALGFASYSTGIATMTALKRENGEPMRVVPRYLMVGPKNHQIGAEITQAQIRGASYANDGLEAGTRIGSAGVTNVFAGAVQLVVNPRLTDTQDDYWYIIGEAPGGAKPLTFLEGRPPTEQLDVDLSSPTVMATDALTYGLIADSKVAAGAWPTIYAGIL